MCGPAALCQALAKAKWLTLTQPVRNERCNVWVCLRVSECAWDTYFKYHVAYWLCKFGYSFALDSSWKISRSICWSHEQMTNSGEEVPHWDTVFHCWKCTVVWKARWPGTKTSTCLLWWLINYDMSSLWERGASMHIAPLHLNEIKKRVQQLLHAERIINQLGAHAKLEFAAVCSNYARVMSTNRQYVWPQYEKENMFTRRCNMWTVEKLLLVCTSVPESWWIIRFHADDSSSSSSLLRIASATSYFLVTVPLGSTEHSKRRFPSKLPHVDVEASLPRKPPSAFWTRLESICSAKLAIWTG